MSVHTVLWWPGKILAEEDLRRHWTSQGEIVLGPKTIVTPLAWDFLRSKKVALRREERPSDTAVSAIWGYAEELPSPIVKAAVQGRSLLALDGPNKETIAWVRSIAAKVAAGTPSGALIFAQEPALAACVANKTRGIRAAIVISPADIKALQKTLGPNLLAVATGRTYFELRQIVQLATASAPVNPIGDLDANR